MNKMKYVLPLFFLPALAVAEPLMPVSERVAELMADGQSGCEIDDGDLVPADYAVSYDFDNDGQTDLTSLHKSDFECTNSLGSVFSGTAGAVLYLMTEIDGVPTDYSHGYVREFQVTAGDGVPTVLLGPSRRKLWHSWQCSLRTSTNH